jgi:hypothetical protein
MRREIFANNFDPKTAETDNVVNSATLDFSKDPYRIVININLVTYISHEFFMTFER